MEFRHLEVFMAVWQTGSITQAAKTINLTQPTVSAHLKALEERVGVRLFDRAGRVVTPTAAGRRFYGYCKQILRLRSELERDISQLLDPNSGTIEIGGSNIPGQYILPRLIGKFKGLYPDVQVSLKIGDTANIVSLVHAGTIELGIVGALIEKKGLIFEPVFNDRLAFVFPSNDPGLRGLEFIDVGSLSEQKLILREKGSGTRLATEIALQNAGLGIRGLKVVAEMGSTEAIRQAVKAGVGCAILSLRAVEDDLKSGSIKSIPVRGLSTKRLFYLVWHGKRSLSLASLRFKDFLIENREL